MNISFFIVLYLITPLLFHGSTFAQQPPAWDETQSLPIWMTPEEESRRGEIGERFTPTDPPDGPMSSIAEFERLKGVMVRYPLGVPMALVAHMSERGIIYAVVSSGQQSNAHNDFVSGGVFMDNVEFIITPTESWWTRDYGPWFAADGDNEIVVIDFPYNRPRPGDDAVPAAFASHTGMPVYGMNVVHTGGNFMSDGYGAAASTDLVYEENNYNEGYVDQTMEDFLGIVDHHVTIDAQGEYIKHIDTWAKFLDVDKILIAEVPESHPRHWAYELVADYFANQTSSYGTPFEVYRVYTPNGEPYTNALILNDNVYVPFVNSAWNEEARATYQQALPGYNVFGVTGNWLSTDALHCRVKDIADPEMLRIRHLPIHGEHAYQSFFTVEADIIPYSGEPLVSESLHLIYREGQGEFDTIPLVHEDGHTYAAQIPVSPSGGEITYYLSAADASGREETWPLIGAPMARSFTVLGADGATVTFSVSDEAGVPLHDATVTLGDVENAPGNYVFVDVPAGTYDYAVYNDCYLEEAGTITVGTSDKQVNVQLGTLPGDANGDGIVDVLDVIAVMQHYVDKSPALFCPDNADVNQDGVINVLDVIDIVNIYMKNQDKTR